MFLVCGEAVIDLFQRTPALSSQDLDFAGHVAGSPLNVAVGLTRLGCKASFMTGLSRDPFGTRVIATLEKENIDWSFAQRTDRATILSFVMIKPDGAPDYAFYGEKGADFYVQAEALPARLPAAIRAIHVAGFPMAIEPSKTAYATLIHREARERFVSLDPNIRPALMGDMDVFRDHFETLAPHAALIKASTEDIGLLYAGVDALTIAKRWRTFGAGTVIMTDGPKGSFALNNLGIAQAPAQSVAIVDTVGAGDSFMSALLARFADHDLLERDRLAGASSATLKSIMDDANRAAGITCTRRGANPPSRAELMSSERASGRAAG